MKPKSLFTRLLLSHAVIILVTMVVLGGMFNYLLQHYLANRLQQQFEKNANTLATNPLIRESIALSAYDILDNVAKQVSQSVEADVIIIDSSGKVLASTANGVVGNALNRDEVKNVLADHTYSRWGGTLLGAPSLTVGNPIKLNNKVIGAVFLDTSIKGFQANMFRFRLFILYAALLALVLAVILAYFLAKSISRPILQMNKAAKALVQGGKTEQVSYQGDDELGTLVNVFNRSIREIQTTLVQQQKLEDQRREFVANVSHEFRAPVTSLQGFLELMQDGVIPEEEQPKYFSLMLKDIGRLNRLVSDLLDLARFQAGQAKIKPVALDPDLLISEVVTKLTPRASEKNISLLTEFPRALSPVLADGDRLEQILLNLVDNALRFTPVDGWIKICIDQGEKETRFSVVDSGIGIPPQDLPYVFERFYKVDKARTPEKGGTGLGLAIVKELVLAHGGKINVESKPGAGTVFSFTLPKA